MALGDEPLGLATLGARTNENTPMPLRWVPDFCPDSPSCVLEVARDWTDATFIQRCAFHQALQTNNALTDRQLYRAVLTSCRRKEAGRAAAKQALALDKEHPGVPYRVDADGGFTLGVDQNGNVMPEWPTGATRTLLVTTIDDAVALRETTTGTSVVRSA